MPEEESQFNPELKKELSEDAKEAILLFQRAKQSTNPEEQIMFVAEFHKKLLDILVPPEEGRLNDNPERLRKVVIEASDAHNYISVGGGTSGQRILFMSYVGIEGEPEVERLAKGAKVVKFENSFEAESSDGKTRWMVYPMPGDGEGSSWGFGEKYWKRYMEAFGNQIVDLLQEIE